MEVIKFPPRDQWASIQTRPVFDYTVLFDRVQKILDDVRQHGDKALINYTKQFDNVNLDALEVTKEEIAEAA
ncbi:MAG TPA: histidinol dehydrogenase, partial [Paludibacteraceae bacterium]|nr:histidinol dehydrogenase [Paludibacteraceae bacterium]